MNVPDCSKVGTLEISYEQTNSDTGSGYNLTPSCSCHVGYSGELCNENSAFSHCLSVLSKDWMFYVELVIFIVLYSLSAFIRNQDTNVRPRSTAIGLVIQRNALFLFIIVAFFGWWHYVVDKQWSASIVIMVIHPIVVFAVSLVIGIPKLDPTFVRVGECWCYFPTKKNIITLYTIWAFTILVLIGLSIAVAYYGVTTIKRYWTSYPLISTVSGLILSQQTNLPITFIEVLISIVNAALGKRQPKGEGVIVEVVREMIARSEAETQLRNKQAGQINNIIGDAEFDDMHHDGGHEALLGNGDGVGHVAIGVNNTEEEEGGEGGGPGVEGGAEGVQAIHPQFADVWGGQGYDDPYLVRLSDIAGEDTSFTDTEDSTTAGGDGGSENDFG